MSRKVEKSNEVKAMIAYMSEHKTDDKLTMYEYKIASSNTRIGVIGQAELKRCYGRVYGDASGATKVCHIRHYETDEQFKYIVIKRFSKYGSTFCKGTGNQVIDEIDTYNKIMNESPADLDFICPIVKAYTTKSDKVPDVNSEKARDNCMIIAQKASHISNAYEACEKAEELNDENGYIGTDADTRYSEIERFCRKYNMHDVLGHGANSGVIFDYEKNCYKAVVIDYAL